MSDQNTFTIPTAEEVAREVVAMLAEKGLVVPSGSKDITAAAEYLGISPKLLRGLVEDRKIKCANLTRGSGQSATLRFSVVELERVLRGE